MPMHVPADARIIRDRRLTRLRVISSLYDRLVNAKGGLKDQIKATLQEKGATYAESDLVISRLQPGNSTGPVDAEQLYGLVPLRRLSLEQFLSCITVRKEPLAQHLSKSEIEAMCIPVADPSPSLVTEFKPDVEVDLELLADELEQALQAAQVDHAASPITPEQPAQA